ncbi:DNA-dependent metalloprotease SPRTN [Pseudophryne corroboree]|uniref:DNA-dependent metalloprotease SPRTN n=1 Tax=Pseudophryne corroboree TaxID=495146 RepID=UPI0030812ED3
MDDADYQLAARLQEQYNREQEAEAAWAPTPDYSSVYWQPERPATEAAASPGVMSVVDPSWELLDPSPDIHALFLQFNDTFFWGKLNGVEVRWSPRMTLCAGVCCYEGRGGLCSIRLSKPLLMLRPRKDLVQTLLHEMIHALLFVTHNNRDRDSHGPEFCKHMNRINSVTGAKISVYHSFHDEVDEYRKHWWLCNGPCQKRKPYFGYVKRAMNRAPSSLDPWWADHKRTCGGTFTKVKEPENFSSKGKKKNDSSDAQPVKSQDDKGKSEGVDIRTFMPFSGTGFKLGKSSQTATAGKVHNAFDSPSTAVKSLPVTPINTILNYRTFSSNKTDTNKVLKPNMPKVSVANTKAFINVSGSPVKLPLNKPISRPIPPVWQHGNYSNSIQSVNSFEMPSSSQSALPAPQGSNIEKHYGQPSKRPRLDGRSIKDFFSNPKSNTTGDEPVIIVNDDHRKVNCPICQVEVSEHKINDHLDNCLA